jgi:phosphatidylserine decarboxylase
MKPLDEWLATDVAEFQKNSLQKASHELFFRDPPRPLRIDRGFFFAPADGVITTQGRFAPDEDLIETKGAQCTVNDILGPQHEIDGPALVINTYMSFADVHINRMPTDATLTHFPLPPLRTQNVPMLWVERGLFEHGKIEKGEMQFVKDNQRVVNKCFCTYLRYHYFMVQIADSDVNCIVHFSPLPHSPMNQCQRFGMIRWGSMVSLIMPLDPRFRFKTLCPTTSHVEAGDPLVAVSRA